MAHLPKPQLLEPIFHHLALPPQLPERQENNLDKIGEALADRLLCASIALRDATYEQFGPCFDAVRRVILTAKTINAGGKLNQISLLKAFRELQGNDLLIVHVAEQNAALLIRRFQDASGWQILFEAFETSPLSEVLTTKAALKWDFPGCAAAVPLSTFENDSFQQELAIFLSQASKESIKRFAARTNKAGSFAYESRDTVDPSLITSMLMTLLEVNGSRKFPPILRKRVDNQRANSREQITYDYMFAKLRPRFSKIIKKVSVHIELAWTSFKQTLNRPVPALPKLANLRHLQLTLPNSRNYIQQVQIDARNSLHASNYQKARPEFDLASPAVQQARAFAKRYFDLADLEETQIGSLYDGNTYQERCIILAAHINTYMKHVGNSYESQPEQLSTMLLIIMELWMEMDKAATVVFSLLLDFSPMFPSHIMDVLQLADFHDMTRLQTVRFYLDDRQNARKGNQTIFDNPSPISGKNALLNEMKELFNTITTNVDRARGRKEVEWEEKCREFEELNRTIAESSCQYTEDEFEGKIHNKHCKKFFLERRAYRFTMRIHEHPLPLNTSHAKAVVFELSIPKAFQDYRDATWRVISTLAFAEIAEEQKPHVLLHEYSELQKFMRARSSQICLASTSKSFLNTHYANPRFPVDIEGITLRCGLKLEYFDNGSKSWIGRSIQKLSFRHHCKLILPVDSPFSMFLSMPEFEADSNGPSSYATIASQTKLPPNANIQEYLSYQTLYSRKARRWPQILIELGSTNLNFSTESASLLMNHLALKVGPANGCDPFGVVHGIFRDQLFSGRLLEHLSHRVESISSNYREAVCMEAMTTLTIRLWSLNVTLSGQAAVLLERIREITLKWINGLRTELQLATNAESSRTFSRYALWAALLCRQTFVIYLDTKHDLSLVSLTSYIQSSKTLQDNLVSETATLPLLLNSALIRDLKTIHHLRYVLKKSLDENPHCLITAICSILPGLGGGTENVFSHHQFEETWWLKIKISANANRLSQTVHFHILEGILLIEGQPVGKLPAEYRKAFVLSQLFGNQSLLAYPSSVPSMSFMLALNMKGHEIHLGLRRDQLVIRALAQQTTLELIPDRVFQGPSSFDLPSSLVKDCVHWLDLNTGIIEIRQHPHIWKMKHSNWKIDMRSRQARRNGPNGVSLVDPHSSLFQRVAGMFNYFEHPAHLTVVSY
ncbi:hypothetical protein BJ875DRAFT_529478 [Amylocarpus encephaloides]|uniref:ubiquitinyl hydrolase 1 n=1 Tax=Amylocarpus encephaloides TaxID=45428 RepID=A0A9P8C0C8_9HELO|nr:hypothetical protein BJ875DRAFT_529478 [Amylocarpus encephaloides]